jgi:hypothetical protein
MKAFIRITKVFAVFFLIFVISASMQGQSDSIYRIPAGTKVTLRMDSEINSKVSSVDDTFTAKVLLPVRIREVVVIPEGVTMEGRVTEVTRAGTAGKRGTLMVRMEKLTLAPNAVREIDGSPATAFVAVSGSKYRWFSVLGGGVLGTIAGTLSGGRNGALIGAGIGTGAGTAVALLRNGHDVAVQEGEIFEIQLNKEVLLPIRDY